jgi:ankyrin repeat protein
MNRICHAIQHTWRALNRAVLTSVVLTTAASGGDLFQAIRNGDIAAVKAQLTKETLEARDKRGATPLMHAAAFGNLATLKLLVEAGADVNARNTSDATALLWCARDPEKARFLIEHGADVNVQSKQGRTPLMVASMERGGSSILALMLEKGADVNAKNPRIGSALSEAAKAGEVNSMRLLLAKGADPNATDFVGRTPLMAAAGAKSPEAVRLLLQNSVDVNAVTKVPQGVAMRTINIIKNGLPNRTKLTALHNAAAYGPVESVRYLLKAGANVNARDGRSLTPLSFALTTEYPSAEIVAALIEAGADVNVADNYGGTPLDWAEKFGFPEVIAMLNRAGAKRGVPYEAPKLPSVERPKPAIALERSVKLLETTSSEFFKGSGCVSCHHQNVIARTQSSAKAAAISINEAAVQEQTSQMKVQWIGMQEEFLQAMLPGGGANRLAENLLGLRAANYPPDTITDSAIVAMAEEQEPSGGWPGGEVQHRPPIAQSTFASTARIIRAFQHYGIPARKQEFTERIARAQAWLKHERPVTTEDFSMRLSGLFWSGAPESDLKEAAKALLALQRSDGGWAGNPHMKSDAYATGVAMVALAESKAIKVNDRSYRRGVEYLLSTQFPDGSWHVRSRAIKFQPYFESGFPFGHDQWISTAATAWAAQALALSIEPAKVTSAAR